jgi:hypothetical protein
MGGQARESNIMVAPSAAAPNANESSAQIAEARLKYDPLMAQQELDLQKQFAPQQAELYQSMYNQYYPQMARQQQQMQQELYPYQSQVVEQGAQSALSRLQNPDYMTPQEQQAINSQREQETTGLMRAMRERANLGGGLYGGRAAGAEAKSVSDLMQSYESQDYSRRMQAGQAAQQALTPYMQILYPQVGTQQPQTGAFQYQSAVPDANTLYNAMFQASQPKSYYDPGNLGGVNLGILGRWGGRAA